jgi:hypothetical protein
MKSKVSIMKSIVVAVALVAGVSGMARADDSSMNPFTGDSYAYFNKGDLPRNGNPVFAKAPSAWRQENPNGLSERVLQSYSGVGEEWHMNKPVFASAPADPTFKQSHPNGLTERELQALSSEAPAWHSPTQSVTSAVASTNEAAFAQRAAK